MVEESKDGQNFIGFVHEKTPFHWFLSSEYEFSELKLLILMEDFKDCLLKWWPVDSEVEIQIAPLIDFL